MKYATPTNAQTNTNTNTPTMAATTTNTDTTTTTTTTTIVAPFYQRNKDAIETAAAKALADLHATQNEGGRMGARQSLRAARAAAKAALDAAVATESTATRGEKKAARIALFSTRAALQQFQQQKPSAPQVSAGTSPARRGQGQGQGKGRKVDLETADDATKAACTDAVLKRMAGSAQGTGKQFRQELIAQREAARASLDAAISAADTAAAVEAARSALIAARLTLQALNRYQSNRKADRLLQSLSKPAAAAAAADKAEKADAAATRLAAMQLDDHGHDGAGAGEPAEPGGTPSAAAAQAAATNCGHEKRRGHGRGGRGGRRKRKMAMAMMAMEVDAHAAEQGSQLSTDLEPLRAAVSTSMPADRKGARHQLCQAVVRIRTELNTCRKQARAALDMLADESAAGSKEAAKATLVAARSKLIGFMKTNPARVGKGPAGRRIRLGQKMASTPAPACAVRVNKKATVGGCGGRRRGGLGHGHGHGHGHGRREGRRARTAGGMPTHDAAGTGGWSRVLYSADRDQPGGSAT